MLHNLQVKIVVLLYYQIVAQDFVKSGQLVKVLPEWTAPMVFSMLFIHHEEVYYLLYVYLLIIW
jgi:hypothetical protein